MKQLFITSFLGVSLFFLIGCGGKEEAYSDIHETGRNNIVEAKPVSLDDSLPMLHSLSNIHLMGDTLIVEDKKSNDKMFFVQDIINNIPLGWFGKIGQGPGELINFGGVFLDSKSHRLLGSDGGTMEFKCIDIDAALKNDECPTVVAKFDMAKNGVLIAPFFLNDTAFIGRSYLYDFDTYTGSNRLVRFNPKTSITTPLGESHPLLQESFIPVYSPESSKIFVIGGKKDFIQIYDFDGNLKRTIYGSDYTDSPGKNMEYFGAGVSDSQGRLYAVYNGRDRREARYRDLLVYSPEGKYLKTIRFDVAHLWDIAYHEPTNRIYFSCDGEPQFGYINLSDYGL
ncbi:MAG: hypothetical protein HDR77_01010 [Bacteroides sp.]|nr:hypothetical protein [Bacteroides sp.]